MTDFGAIGCGSVLVGRYELVAELARGAMGDVFEAVDRETGANVAVKVLRAEYLADDSMRRRFRREGAVLKALDHPSIVRLLELGVDDEGTVFLVTEYMDGETLRERLSRGAVTIEDADALVESLCGGLGAAHDHGVLHGDLKPGNVVWSAGGQPRLIDFGASKVLGLDRLTATGEISGTPTYMAPEVLTGKADIDERIDVYGMGVLLYEALSGNAPFQDGHVGRLLMKIDAGDCLPLDAVAEVTSEVAAAVGHAMHHDKTRRYRTMAELEEAWRRARRI